MPKRLALLELHSTITRPTQVQDVAVNLEIPASATFGSANPVRHWRHLPCACAAAIALAGTGRNPSLCHWSWACAANLCLGASALCAF